MQLSQMVLLLRQAMSEHDLKSRQPHPQMLHATSRTEVKAIKAWPLRQAGTPRRMANGAVEAEEAEEAKVARFWR